MENNLGRMRFQGAGVRFRDTSYEEFERSVFPGADPGDPKAGTPIEDEALAPGDPEASAKIRAILAEARKQIQALGYDISFDDEPVERLLNPAEQFQRTADEHWGNKRKVADAHRQAGNLSPVERFVAAAKKHWGE